MIHLLDFPYNGETRPDQLMAHKITPLKYFLSVLSVFCIYQITSIYVLIFLVFEITVASLISTKMHSLSRLADL